MIVRRFVMLVTLGAVLASSPAALAAQRPQIRVLDDTTVVQQLHLRDGTTLIGRVVAIDGDRVTVHTLGGIEVVVRRGDIVRVAEVQGVRREGEFWPADPSDSRLFLGPTARVPQQGHGYFGVYEVFIASAAVGIGDIAMISGGVSLLPGISLDEQVFYIAPKVQLFDAGAVQGAAGVFWVKPGTSEESAGMVFGGLTGGDQVLALTGGLGFPFASRSGFADEVLVLIGGEYRATRRLKLISENWIVPGVDDALISLGVRILGDRLTVEAAAVTSTDGEFVLPLVSFSVTW